MFNFIFVVQKFKFLIYCQILFPKIMRKLSLKKAVLTMSMAGLLLTTFATLDKPKKFGVASPPNIVESIIQEVNSGFDKISKVISNAFNTFAPNGTTSGVVFRDNDGSGAKNGTEANVAGVTVNLYTAANPTTPCGTTTSTTSGWTITSATCTGALRVEFVIPTNGTAIGGLTGNDYSAPAGGTSVQFVNDGATNVNFGLMNPDMYCGTTNPKMATPVYQATGVGTDRALTSFSYNNTGLTGDAAVISTTAQIGSTWGLAYDKVRRQLYSAAVLKAHNPLGPEGLDAIYVTNPTTGGSTKFVELQDDLGIAVSSTSAEPQYLSNATRQLNDALPENDTQAFQDAGKVGLGDIDISTDGKLLYVVNLFDKKLYTIDIATKSLVGAGISIPQPCAGASRPWGLAVQNGQVFAGAVCENATTAAVYELVGGAFVATPVLSFSLAYPREPGFSYGGCENNKGWKPWITGTTVPPTCDGAANKVIYATPIMTDIEFDDAGNMILGFTDRTGFQFDDQNYGPTGSTLHDFNAAGDILRACTANGTSWTIEGTGCASTTGGPGNNGGQAININDATGYNPAGAKPGEFFWGDYFHGDGDLNGNLSWLPGHPEITIGGLAVLPGTGEVMSTSYDPVTMAANYGTGGVISLSTTTGVRPRNGYQLYRTDNATSDKATAGKGVGLGDLEILCDPAPIELGNRIWRDTDGDGIQDPGEPVVSGVTLELFVDANLDGIPDGPAIGTTTTDASGNYIFKASNVADGDPTVAGNQPGPAANTNYIIRAAASDWTGGAGTGDLAGLAPTLKDVGGAGQPDVRDNDAAVVGGNLQISVTTGTQGNSIHTLDIGLVPAVSIGSTVFQDVNNNGKQDATELGLSGAVVKLYAANGTTPILGPDGNQLTVTTDATGNYFFGNLPAGTYVVGVTPPVDWPTSSTDPASAAVTAGDNQTDADDNGTQATSGAEAKSKPIVLTPGSEPLTAVENGPGTGGAQDNGLDANGDMTVDFGFFAPVSIGSTVYKDGNNNGTQDPAEVGLAGATVKLYKADGVTPATDIAGNTLAPITTDGTGNYYFPNLPPGDYVVGVTPPSTTPNISSTTVALDNQTDGDNNGGAQAAPGGESKSPVINLTSNAEPTTEAAPGTGGAQDNGTPVADASGDMTVDFGFYEPVSVGSTVFFDANNNGSQDGTEVGIAGAKVNLYKADGVTLVGVPEITTDGTGNYYFGNLPPGDYVVGVKPPSTHPTSSTTTVTTDENSAAAPGDGLDNGTQATSGAEAKSPIITLAAGSEATDATETAPGTGGAQDVAADNSGDMTVDFGFFAPVSIGSTVFNDTNNNGSLDGTESGLAGATVKLYNDADGNGVLEGAELTAIATAPVTDGTGNYYFGNLAPGNYVVGVTPPIAAPVSSTTTVTTDENNPAAPGDGLDNGTQASAGAEAFSPVINLSAGNEPTGSTEAAAANGGADDASGDSSGDMTVDFGFFQPVSIGSTVFFDENNNGIQDPSEVGIADAVVTLYQADGTTPVPGVPTQTTNGTGLYYFENLMPGTYMVGVMPSVLYPMSSKDITSTVGDNQTDADDNGVQAGGSGTEAKSSPIVLTAGIEPTGTSENGPGTGGAQDTASGDSAGDMTIDFGFFAPVSIGSTVFNDKNNNGTQDAGDLGIAGAMVTLYNADGITPAVDGAGNAIPVQTTGADGNYYFPNLAPGSYVVGVKPPALYPTSSTTTVTGDTQADDAEDHGTQTASGDEAKSGVIVLKAGTEPTGTSEAVQGVGGTQDDAGDANGDMTVDFGFYAPVSVGSLVYFDINNDGLFDPADGDTPLDGAVVKLYKADGTTPATDATGAPLAPITTDATGLYYFGNLLAGDYVVGVTPPADAATSSTPTVAADDNGAGDGLDNGTQSAPAAEAKSPVITLLEATEPTGETLPGGTSDNPGGALDATADAAGDMTVDFGFYAPVSIGSLVFNDLNNNGIFDSATETPLAGATVNLYNADGSPATDANGAALAPITTTADGLYYFGNLLPGDYKVGVTPPTTAPVSSTPTITGDTQTDDGKDHGTQAAAGAEAMSGVITLAATTEATGETSPGGTQDDANALDSSGDMSIDFGFFQPVSIGSLVYLDKANNGAFDTGTDTPIAGATVTLYKADGTTLATDANGAAIAPITTLANGLYYFGNLLPGDYVVGVTPAASAPLSSTPTVAADDNGGGDGLDNGTQSSIGLEAKSPVVTLAAGTEPAGETLPGGTQDNPGGATDVSSDTAGDMTVDFGFFAPLSIGSTAFIDANNNGTQDSGEAGIPGLTVNLYGADGTTVLKTTTTDGDGNYAFNDLLEGTYTVGMSAPTAYPKASTPVTANTGTAADVDAKNNGTQAGGSGTESKSSPIVLTSGGQPLAEPGQQGTTGPSDLTAADADGNATIDFGFYAPMSIGSVVFLDKANNGFFDESSDSPIAGALVTLYESDGVTIAKDASGANIAPFTTLADGLYLFSNLLPGDYKVGVKPIATAPVSSTPTITADDNGADNLDNGTQASSGADAFSPVITLSPGTEPIVATEFGAGGAQDTAIPGGDANGDMTVDFGFVPLMSLGSTAFIDLNNDGIQSGAGETGIDGLTVTLYQADGVTPVPGVVPVTTSGGGNYAFNNLAPGTYVVGMSAPTAYPNASTPVTANAGVAGDTDGVNTGTQAGGAGTESKSGPIALVGGLQPLTEAEQGAGGLTADDNNGNATIDFGFVPPLSLGSTAFIDLNNDGIQLGAGETGISGLTVNLYDATAPTVVIATTTTNGTGDYFFNGLLPGNYIVGMSAPVAYPNASTPVTANSGVAADVDGKNNGTQAGGAGTESKSGTIALAAGTQPVSEAGQGTAGLTAADANGNATIDFGFFTPVSVSGNVFVDTNGPAAVDGAGYAAPAATLFAVLVDGTGEVAGVAPIGTDGTFNIANVAPGTYTALLTTTAPIVGDPAPVAASLPAGYSTVSEGLGATPTTPDASPNSIMTTPIVVTGANVPDVNFGINNPALPVDLVNFLATQFDEQINLDWKTANEKQFSHFELQRSENAKEFGSIATVNSNGISQYNYADINPIEGINYYRLKMVDIDGTSKLSKVISVNFEKGAYFVSVENPANNGEFALNTNMKDAKFTLLNSLGVKVNLQINETGHNGFALKSTAPAGVYYLNIVSKGKVVTKKVVIP